MCDMTGCNNQGEIRTQDCNGERPRWLCGLHFVGHAHEHAKCSACFGSVGTHNRFRERMASKHGSWENYLFATGQKVIKE